MFREAMLSSRPNNFSSEGLDTLYAMLIQVEEACGVEFELDPKRFRREYTEYDSIDDYNMDYDSNHTDAEEITEDALAFMINDERTKFIVQNW